MTAVRDHPRSRGVYGCSRMVIRFSAGSSPLARGLPQVARHTRIAARIIPARAGFTQRAVCRRPGRSDHPRSRGVYHGKGFSRTFPTGSSPLARGLPDGEGHVPIRRRIIPARAGFTVPGQRSRRPWTDHPRSRGVYARPGMSAGPRSGSSPLARGLLAGRLQLGGRHGIIPARAGFTPPRS